MSTRAGQVLLGIAAVGLLLIVLLSLYVWRQDAFNVLMGVAFLCLLALYFGVGDRGEELRADVDELAEDMDAVKAHLTGNELPGAGRHSDGEPASYHPRSPTSPRSLP